MRYIVVTFALIFSISLWAGDGTKGTENCAYATESSHNVSETRYAKLLDHLSGKKKRKSKYKERELSDESTGQR